jgi:SAM-dependent methyltransferase
MEWTIRHVWGAEMAGKGNRRPAISDWEKAEIERSAHEASGTQSASLLIKDIERYDNPPQSTVYPLEYSCYLLGDIREKVALDFGCGAGENTILLAMRGARVIALDISPELMQLARRRFEVMQVPTQNVRFMVGSAYETGLPDESVDVVFGIGILHHLDLKLAQKEVYRLLRKGGIAVFQEPVRDSKFIRLIRSLIPYKSPDVSPFERPLTSEELDSFAAPFKLVEKRAFYLPHVPIVGSLFPRFIKAAYEWDGKILSAISFLNRYAGIRVLKLTK